MNDRRWTRRWLQIVFSVSLVVGFAVGTGLAAPAKIGELEMTWLATPHPYPEGAGAKAETWVVYYPGATYIRVHFGRFDLAPGDWLEISNPDGSESHTFDGKGPHGTAEFWAFSILGDTAVLRLQANFGGGYGFEVDSFGRGTEPLSPPRPAIPESVCGTQDWKDVKCYESSRPTEYAESRGAVLALIGAFSACTAFKVSDSGQFITNNHCTATQSGVQSTELRFEYELPECGSGSAGYTGAVMGSQLLKTDRTLDYTLFATTGSSASIPCLQLDDRLPPVGERIYIAGHPLAGPKKLSIDSDRDASGQCAVDASPYPGNDPTSDVGYYCDTDNGSSGSPVLSGVTNKVVALHHFGGCPNSGARMDRIVPQISGLLGTCTGGGGSCGDGTCGAGEDSCTCPADCGPPPATETSCTDGKDNDCDGKIDCADPDCSADPACVSSCSPKGTSCVANADCCSNRCVGAGKSGKRTCK